MRCSPGSPRHVGFSMTHSHSRYSGPARRERRRIRPDRAMAVQHPPWLSIGSIRRNRLQPRSAGLSFARENCQSPSPRWLAAEHRVHRRAPSGICHTHTAVNVTSQQPRTVRHPMPRIRPIDAPAAAHLCADGTPFASRSSGMTGPFAGTRGFPLQTQRGATLRRARLSSSVRPRRPLPHATQAEPATRGACRATEVSPSWTTKPIRCSSTRAIRRRRASSSFGMAA
jgi:hypothetical protein